jgi:hypothetical protein
VGDSEVELLEPEVFDKAIVGLAYRFGGFGEGQEVVVAYDRAKCIEVLMNGEMDEEGAEEFFEFNTIGAWWGPGTPLFIERIEV